MEKTVSDLADLVKKLREDRVSDREADREAVNSLKKVLEENTAVMKDIVNWRSQVDSKVDELQLSVKDLGTKVERIALRQDEAEDPDFKVFHSEHPDFSKPAAAHLAATSSQAASGHNCQGDGEKHRGSGQGVVTTLVPTPVKGANAYSEFTPMNFSMKTVMDNLSTASPINAAVPQLSFPVFDGSSPKVWKKKCETYFDIYDVPANIWVKIAIMNFQGSADFLLQSLDHHYSEFSWKTLCDAVCARFDRDQHSQLLRHFFHVRQNGTVTDYIEKFNDLVHQILAHDSNFSAATILSRFIDGLRDDIKAVVMIHRPENLDTASTIALLQEELTMDLSKKEVKKNEGFSGYKLNQKSLPFTTPANSSPVVSLTKPQITYSSPEEKKAVESMKPAVFEEKLSALRSYRRAKGLYYKCGVKWNPGHKCASTVSIHVVEELWQMINGDSEVSFDVDGSDSGEELMAISVYAAQGTESLKTVRMVGNILKQEVIMLIDSGSSHNFISETLATKLPNWVPLRKPVDVRVANGNILLCTHELVDQPVSINGHQFLITLRILPLHCYDVILGMEWLEQHSPMMVSWKEKWMAFDHEDQHIKLQGVRSEFIQCSEITIQELFQLEQNDEVWCILEVLVTESSEVKVKWPDEIQQLIDKFANLFQEPKGVPPARSCAHEIPLLPGSQPFRLRPYRYNPAQKDEIERQVDMLLRNGMIQESVSPFASPILLVKKKTGDWRLCVDYRRLNAMTVKNKFPLPIIEEILDELVGARWFTTLDLSSGFHQILMKLQDRYKTAFQTHHGHYEYLVMPYGVTGGPATFQQQMNTLLGPFLRKFVVVFIDDILIYSKTWEEHLQHIESVFSVLQEQQFKVKLPKCAFAQEQLSYLGHVISVQGVSTDPRKVADVQKWPTPQSVKELRGFLGLAGYYRRFVKNFSLISRTLSNLLKKGEIFLWTSTHEEAFQTLKLALTSAPVLALPDFHKQFIIETDASEKGIGAVLQQDGHPVAYVSRALGSKNQGLSTYEKEFLAILLAIDQWRQYLTQGEFIIRTDQRSLVHLDDQRLHTPWQHKALTKLLGLKYKICYKKGNENRAADALSRIPPHEHQELIAISTVQQNWFQDISESYIKHPATAKLLAALTVNNNTLNQFTYSDGIIKYRNRIWVDGCPDIQLKICQALHSSPVGGHSGFQATYVKIKQLFAWPKMKQRIKEFVQQCTVCQQAKYERVKYPGLLQSLPVPDYAWQIEASPHK
ncbi:unnamed protein product [Urochloa humidicola]